MRWAAGLVFLLGCGPKDDGGTYRNEFWHFSHARPQGWQAVVPATDYAKEVGNHVGGRLIEATREALLNPTSGKNFFVVAFIKMDSPDPLLPVIGVRHNPVGFPQVGDEELKTCG